MLRWMGRYREEGLPLRRRQIIEHFAPAAQQQPFYQHYADMVTALDNLGTLASIIEINRALSLHYPESLLDRITSPTLIIAGTEDWSYGTVGELQQRIKGSALRAIEGAGHGVPIEAPVEYNRHTIDFLNSIGLFPE